MSFDLYVWREPAPITVAEARAKLAAWNDGDLSVFPSHVSVPLLRAELLARFPPREPRDTRETREPRETRESREPREQPRTTSNGHGVYAWTVSPSPSASLLVLSGDGPQARTLTDAVRSGAQRHGLVCYDADEDVVEPNAPSAAGFLVSSARLAPVSDPGDHLLERTVRNLSADNFFVVLERSDGWFVQVGFGPRAGVADGRYALEYSDGDRHFRCESPDVAEALRLVRDFRAGEDGWRTRLPWQRFEP